jgi:hypothetical protein
VRQLFQHLSSLNGKWIEKSTSPPIVFINWAKVRFSTDSLPIVANGCLDPLNRIDSGLSEKQELVRGRRAGFELGNFGLRVHSTVRIILKLCPKLNKFLCRPFLPRPSLNFNPINRLHLCNPDRLLQTLPITPVIKCRQAIFDAVSWRES